jgi:hypothetical protein
MAGSLDQFVLIKDGLRVSIRKSKTDQEGLGVKIAIARGSTACPVDAVSAWLKAAAIAEGPLFRSVTRTQKVSDRRLSARAVAELVKAYALRAGSRRRILAHIRYDQDF